MDVVFWYQIVGAVIGGNVLTFMFGYFVWYASRQEKRGKDPYDLPLGVCVCGIIPPLVGGVGMYLLVV